MRFLLVGLLLAVFLGGCAGVPERAPQDTPDPQVPLTEQDPIFVPEEEAYEAISLAMSIGDPEAAIAAYQEAELADPEAPDTQVLLANLYLAAGDVESAEAILREVLEADPSNDGALYLRSLIAGARGDREAQTDLLEAALAANPDNAQAQASLGELRLQNREYGPAEEAFTASLEQEPDNLVALIGLGNVKLRTEEPEVAEEILTRAIDSAPEYSFAYADRSRARAMQYNLERAAEDLDRAVALDEDYIWHRYDRGLVRLEQNDLTGAIEDFSWVIDRDPSVFLTYVYRGRARDRLDQRQGAIADYEAALERRPDYFPAYAPVAVLYFEEGRFGDAADFFSQAWSGGHPNDPRDPGMAVLASLAWKLQGEESRAREFLEEAAADFPRPSLWYDLARYYLRPTFDATMLRAIEDEEDRLLKARMQFYMGGQYEALESSRSAAAMYREVQDSELRGFIETRLARHRLAQMEAPE